MTPSFHELLEAMFDTEGLPFGRAQIAAAERVAAEVEAAGERRLLPSVYHSLVSAYTFGGELKKAFVPFSKQVRLYDAEPELFDEGDSYRFLWSYKWMTADLWKFPAVPREQIERTIEDMERRYALAGVGLRAVAMTRFGYAWQRGDRREAARRFGEWTSRPQDAYSDCEACERHQRGAYLAAIERDAEALEQLGPVLTEGLTCAEEPHFALAAALQPYLRLGRVDDARHAHLKGIRLIRGGVQFQLAFGNHLAFLARTGNEPRGLELLGADPAFLVKDAKPLDRLDLLAGAGLLLRRAAEVGGDTLAVTGPSGPTTVGELAGWVRREALTLAGAFDARNGTGWQSQRVLRVLDAQPLVPALRLGFGQRAVAPAAALPGRAAAQPAGDVSPAVGDRVMAESARARGLDVTALVDRAEELTEIGHPAAKALWRSAETTTAAGADDVLRARIEEGLGRTLLPTDLAAGRERLDRAVAIRARLGDELTLALTRARAAIAAVAAGDHAALTRLHSASAVIEALGSPVQRLDQRYRLAWAAFHTAGDDPAQRSLAARLLRDTAAEATLLGDTATALSATTLLQDLEPPQDPADAVAFWQSSIETLRGLGREWELPTTYGKLGSVCRSAGWLADRPDEVLAAYDDAVRLADQWGQPAVAALAAYRSAEVLDTLERLDEARGRGFDAVVRAEDAGLETLAVAARARLGMVYHQLGRHHEAVEFLDAALPALQADPGYTALVHSRLGLALGYVGQPRDAARHLAIASEIAERGDDLYAAAESAGLAADALARLDEPDAATAAHERAVRLYGEVGAHFEILGLRRTQASRLADDGHDDEALAELERATAAADALAPGDVMDPRRERAELHYHAAWILCNAGHGPQALERSAAAEREHTEIGAHVDASDDATLASRILLHLLARPQDAEAAARRAMRLAEAGTAGEYAYEAAEEALADALEALDPAG